jgi:beta-glucosidase
MPISRRRLLAGSTAALASPVLARSARATPSAFTWGASTSAYQIEGGVREDGRGPSIWDGFSHAPGHTANGDTGDIACDHYHRVDEDVDWIARGGFNAYRFSIAWPRIFPEGSGTPNPKGLDFYERLVDRLRGRGIEPWLCLYHWDLPQALQDQGGWLNRSTAGHFVDYARTVAARLGDRVGHWAMFNEPNIHAIFGHTLGGHAPNLKGWPNFAPAIHHQSLAQGLAIVALRAERSQLQLGTVLSIEPVHPASDSEADRNAATRFDAVWNRACLDPLLAGTIPALLADAFAPVVQDGDLATIHQPVDFLGINYYSRLHVRDDPGSALLGAGFGATPPGTAFTAMGWPIEPDGLYEQLLILRDRYGNPPVYVTENGAAFDDKPDADGHVQDDDRVAFLSEHIAAAMRARRDGADLRGYFVWSLMDNFEWAEGYTRRFGLLRVDFKTLKRVPKASFSWLAQRIREG